MNHKAHKAPPDSRSTMTSTAASTASSTTSASDHSLKPPRGLSLQRSICFSLTFITLLIFFQLETLNNPLPSSSWTSTLLFGPSSATNHTKYLYMLRDSVTFLPLKDLRFSSHPTSGHTWFMSSLNDTHTPGESEHLYFPSTSSNGRLLCLSGGDISDGARNSYALAFAEALPENAALVRGLTFVSDTHYDYGNLWHGLSAVVPFVAWHERNGCEAPARWVLYHWGELRRGMGTWVRTLTEAAIGEEMKVEMFEGSRGPACFERAVVFRHNEGAMAKARKQEVYDMMRCRARAYCKVKMEDQSKVIRMTLWFRSGSRSFRDEEAVVEIFESECRKVEGCRIKFARPGNLTFCDQVSLTSETDILVSPHGAQMTNMLFMDKGSSVMEFFPKGWLEFAGIGQFVFSWMADWAGMRHQGQWKDSEGEPCPYNNNDDCFTFYKDGQIGHDKVFFANWTAKVLNEVRRLKLAEATTKSSNHQQYTSTVCPCS